MGDRGHEFETRHPLHFGCVLSLRRRMTWCWRCGMCATQGLSHVQRDTTSDGMLASGHSRSGTTQALVTQQAEQPPCKRQAARSNRRRGAPLLRVRIPHGAPHQKVRTSLAQLDQERRSTKPEVARSNRARGAITIRTHQPCRASSTGRAAASKAEGSRFDSVVRCQFVST
jgi:hypothetical protein